MTKAFYITFSTTHNTMKANKLLKSKFDTKVIPAPKELNESGCSIALKLNDISKKEEIIKILEKNNLQIKTQIEL